MNHTASHGRTSAQASSRALLGDKVILAAIALSALAAVAIGFLNYEPTMGLVGALALAGLGVGGYAMARGTLFSRMVLTTCSTD